jgi:hypothetical protein
MTQLDAQRNSPRRGSGKQRTRCGNFSARISPLRRPVMPAEPRVWPVGEPCGTITTWIWKR